MLAYDGDDAVANLPVRCPFNLGDVMAERIDSLALLERLRP
jgi:hypothetical protein